MGVKPRIPQHTGQATEENLITSYSSSAIVPDCFGISFFRNFGGYIPSPFILGAIVPSFSMVIHLKGEKVLIG